MDYEKKYNEAFELIKPFYPGAQGEMKKQFEKVFPQLKESEDERIRKALIKQFSAISMETWAGVPKIDIISWLEKQKEPKPDVNACKARARFINNILSGNDMKKMVELYNDEIPEGKNVVWAVIYPDKPKEQKSAEYIEDSLKFKEGFKAGWREIVLRTYLTGAA